MLVMSSLLPLVPLSSIYHLHMHMCMCMYMYVCETMYVAQRSDTDESSGPLPPLCVPRGP